MSTQRLRTLEFRDRHGLETALEYSGKCRCTLYSWRRRLRERGLIGLCSHAKAPRHRPAAQLAVLLLPWCNQRGLRCPSASTIGRLIGDAADQMRGSKPALTAKGKPKVYRRRVQRRPKVYRRRVQRRPKGYRPQQLGECVGLDAIERRRGGVKRYILSDIDEVSDYALALVRASTAGRRRCSWSVASSSRHSPANKWAPTAAASSGAVSINCSPTATSRINGLIRKRRR